MVKCTVAWEFWGFMKEATGVKLPDLHPLTWAHDLLEAKVCSKKDAAMIMCGMWTLWTSRNKRRHGQINPWPLRQAVFWARDTAMDLWHILHDEMQKKQTSVPVWHWQPPHQGSLKCNTDAAYDDESRTGAVGALLHDEAGNYIIASAHWMPYVLSALAAEAQGSRTGLQLAVAHGATKVILEKDCKVLVDLWHKEGERRS
ncbi:hypothetical protein HU200_001346 [Digitaria exilis]|uniref:RNase H type-1 domain-containing protein n=1 Tax=Digitaria exilis TaxID=1010633 RepID=A0A835FZ83_9POAL|nr:hypothetical protein HU200_001346 [Digitaria exilis]